MNIAIIIIKLGVRGSLTATGVPRNNSIQVYSGFTK